MDFAFKFVKEIGGLDTERDYPYWCDRHPCIPALCYTCAL